MTKAELITSLGENFLGLFQETDGAFRVDAKIVDGVRPGGGLSGEDNLPKEIATLYSAWGDTEEEALTKVLEAVSNHNGNQP